MRPPGNQGGPKCHAWPKNAATLYAPAEGPCEQNLNDGRPLILGQEVKTEVDGEIRAIRYYRSSKDSGKTPRIGYIYSYHEGERLATTGLFTDSCSRGGWVSVPLVKPLHVARGTTYVVAFEGLEFYAKTPFLFQREKKVKGGLTARGDGGLFGFEVGQMPRQHTRETASTGYWVDGKLRIHCESLRFTQR